MYTKGFWIIFASCEQIGSKVVWGKCGGGDVQGNIWYKVSTGAPQHSERLIPLPAIRDPPQCSII